MSFGWSAGDIVAAVQLLYKIGTALKDTDGAASDYQDVSSFFETLSSTLRCLNACQAIPVDAEIAANLREHCRQIQAPLQAFLSDIQRDFESALGRNCTRSKALTAKRKVQWALSTSKKARALRERISGSVAAITVILCQQMKLRLPALYGIKS